MDCQLCFGEYSDIRSYLQGVPHIDYAKDIWKTERQKQMKRSLSEFAVIFEIDLPKSTSNYILCMSKWLKAISKIIS